MDKNGQEDVSLIAAGYEWVCPECNHENKEPEFYNEVICWNCGKIFKTNDPPDHAYH